MAYGKIKMGKGDGRIKVDPREMGGFNPEPKPGDRPGGRPGYKPPFLRGDDRVTIMPVPKPGNRRARTKPMPIGVKPGGPVIKPGRPVPSVLERGRKPISRGKPGLRVGKPVPRRGIGY